MARYAGNVANELLVPLIGASIYVYAGQYPDLFLADLTDDLGTPIENPVSSNEYGDYSFNTDDGVYRLEYWYQKRQRTIVEGVIVGVVNLFPFSQVATYQQDSIGRKLQQTVSVKDFGAIGDNTADDTAAITAAINYCQGQTRPQALNFGTGLYKVTSLPTISKPMTFVGDNPRSSQIMLSGTANAVNILGVGTRAESITFRNISLNANAMTAGYAVVIDWAQNILFDNAYIVDPFNGLSIRQAGNVTLDNVLIDQVRGNAGIFAYGSNTTRNGENDQIDVLVMKGVVVQAGYSAGGAVPTEELIVLDGRVHTVQFDGVRALNGLRGLVCKNTPALAANLVPRFIIGSSIECENHYAEPILLSACVDFNPDFVFAVGSYTADGIKLGAEVGNFRPKGGSINSNFFAGIDTNGASNVDLSGLTIYNNSLTSAGVKPGIYVSGSGTFQMRGGLSGKALWLPAYTENQRFGLDMDPAFSGTISMNGVDLRGNNTGALFDNGTTAVGSSVTNCPGYSPGGTALQSVGASPYTYTAGLRQEVCNVYLGTVSNITIDGVSVGVSSPCLFTLPPRKSAIITYSSVPTMAVTKQ